MAGPLTLRKPPKPAVVVVVWPLCRPLRPGASCASVVSFHIPPASGRLQAEGPLGRFYFLLSPPQHLPPPVRWSSLVSLPFFHSSLILFYLPGKSNTEYSVTHVTAPSKRSRITLLEDSLDAMIFTLTTFALLPSGLVAMRLEWGGYFSFDFLFVLLFSFLLGRQFCFGGRKLLAGLQAQIRTFFSSTAVRCFFCENSVRARICAKVLFCRSGR